jgi:hypothetical protein
MKKNRRHYQKIYHGGGREIEIGLVCSNPIVHHKIFIDFNPQVKVDIDRFQRGWAGTVSVRNILSVKMAAVHALRGSTTNIIYLLILFISITFDVLSSLIHDIKILLLHLSTSTLLLPPTMIDYV